MSYFNRIQKILAGENGEEFKGRYHVTTICVPTGQIISYKLQNKYPLVVSILGMEEGSSLDLNNILNEYERKEKIIIPNHVVCPISKLKEGDIIIHNYKQFKVCECCFCEDRPNLFFVRGKFLSGDGMGDCFYLIKESLVIKLV